MQKAGICLLSSVICMLKQLSLKVALSVAHLGYFSSELEIFWMICRTKEQISML
jgi:hypothetical protein